MRKMSDLIGGKMSRDFFQGKGKRKTLTSGPASVKPVPRYAPVKHIMPDGSLMNGMYHKGQGPAKPAGPMGPAGKPKRKRMTPDYMMKRKGY